MKSVRIAELKAKLSEYLRGVRRGQTVIVMDRETPIARIVPYESATEHEPNLVIRKPTDLRPPGQFKFPPPLKTNGKLDIVKLLLEDRHGDR